MKRKTIQAFFFFKKIVTKNQNTIPINSKGKPNAKKVIGKKY
jgi:hypothetical protein